MDRGRESCAGADDCNSSRAVISIAALRRLRHPSERERRRGLCCSPVCTSKRRSPSSARAHAAPNALGADPVSGAIPWRRAYGRRLLDRAVPRPVRQDEVVGHQLGPLVGVVDDPVDQANQSTRVERSRLSSGIPASSRASAKHRSVAASSSGCGPLPEWIRTM